MIHRTQGTVIFGGGGHALVVHDLLESLGYDVVGFFDEQSSAVLSTLAAYLGAYSPQILSDQPLVMALGSNRTRANLIPQVRHQFVESLVHPSAAVSTRAALGVGTVVFRGAIVQPLAKVGAHCILNSGAIVEHQCVLGDFVHIAPNATLCGQVTIGEGSLIGAGAVVVPGVSVGAWSVVGAGAVVTKDVAPGTTVVGVPARKMR